jgi:hypothetical protein
MSTRGAAGMASAANAGDDAGDDGAAAGSAGDDGAGSTAGAAMGASRAGGAPGAGGTGVGGTTVVARLIGMCGSESMSAKAFFAGGGATLTFGREGLDATGPATASATTARILSRSSANKELTKAATSSGVVRSSGAVDALSIA